MLIVVMILAAFAVPAIAQDGGEDSTTYPLTVTDETGTEITFEETPESILCLSIACLDHLYLLGVEPAGLNNILAGPYTLHFGELNDDLTLIGGGQQPNLEEIAEMNPDLIIGQAGFFDALREPLADVAPLFLIYPRSVENTLEQLRTIGQITDRVAEAETEIEAFENRLAAYRELAPNDKSLMIVFGAAEDDTAFIEADNGQTCRLLEGLAECPFALPENAGPFGAFGYEYFSFEAVLEANPDAIFFSGYNPDRSENTEMLEQLNESALWSALDAVQADDVYPIEPWVWRGGHGVEFMRITLDTAMTTLYPDVFPEPLTEDDIAEILGDMDMEADESDDSTD
jgi:iron complex transport system substrate-binding protein